MTTIEPTVCTGVRTLRTCTQGFPTPYPAVGPLLCNPSAVLKGCTTVALMAEHDDARQANRHCARACGALTRVRFIITVNQKRFLKKKSPKSLILPIFVKNIRPSEGRILSERFASPDSDSSQRVRVSISAMLVDAPSSSLDVSRSFSDQNCIGCTQCNYTRVSVRPIPQWAALEGCTAVAVMTEHDDAGQASRQCARACGALTRVRRACLWRTQQAILKITREFKAPGAGKEHTS